MGTTFLVLGEGIEPTMDFSAGLQIQCTTIMRTQHSLHHFLLLPTFHQDFTLVLLGRALTLKGCAAGLPA